jgi:hypothetical protein
MMQTARFTVGAELDTEEFGHCRITEVFRGCQGRVAYTVRPHGGPEEFPAEFLIMQDDMNLPPFPANEESV